MQHVTSRLPKGISPELNQGPDPSLAGSGSNLVGIHPGVDQADNRNKRGLGVEENQG